VERAPLERIELDAETGLEGRARRAHGVVVVAVAPDVLDVAAVDTVVPGVVVVLVFVFATEEGGVTTALEDERCRKTTSRTTGRTRARTTQATADESVI